MLFVYCIQVTNSLPKLPSSLSEHSELCVCIFVQLIVDRSHMPGEFFNLYLHQNYLDFFSEVEDVERASKYLSDADLLTADWTVSLSLHINS